MPSAITCPRCHAPLPAPLGSFVTCAYCGATSSLGGVRAEDAAAAPATLSEPAYEDRVKAATATFDRVIAAGGTAEQAAWYAAHDFRAEGLEPGEVGYGAIGLAKDFDATNGTETLRDGTCVVRLCSAYAKAVAELRAKGGAARTTINLPFFTATSAGPLHLERSLDAPGVAALLAKARASSSPR